MSILNDIRGAYLSIEKTKVANNNRLGAAKRNGASKAAIERLEGIVSELGSVQDYAQREMEDVVEDEVLWSGYLKHVKGIAQKSAALIIGGPLDVQPVRIVCSECGALNPPKDHQDEQFCKSCETKLTDEMERRKCPESVPYPSCFVSYCGLGTDDEGRPQKMRSGEGGNFNSLYKGLIMGRLTTNWLRAEGQSGSYYGSKWYEYREKEERKDVEKDLPDGQKKFRADRKVGKLFLHHLWTVWRKVEGLPTKKPYPMEHENQAHSYIPPIVEIDGEVLEWEPWYYDNEKVRL